MLDLIERQIGEAVPVERGVEDQAEAVEGKRPVDPHTRFAPAAFTLFVETLRVRG